MTYVYAYVSVCVCVKINKTVKRNNVESQGELMHKCNNPPPNITYAQNNYNKKKNAMATVLEYMFRSIQF